MKLKRFLSLCLGLLLSGLGISLVVKAGLGAFPQTALNLGIANTLGLNYGTASIITEGIIILINLLNKEKIGWSTLGHSFIVGYVITFFLWLIPESTSMFMSILLIFLGMVTLSIGYYFSTSCGFGNGSSNGFMVVMVKKTKSSIFIVRTIMEIAFMLGGLILGGNVGIATIILSFTFGYALSFIYKLLKFKPECVKHDYIDLNNGIFSHKKNYYKHH